LARKSKRKWQRWIVAILIGIVSLPVSALMVAKTAWARERARTLAIAALHDELGLNARIRAIDVEVFPPAVVARGIEIDHPTEGRLVSASSLRIEPSLASLLQGKLDLDSIELDRPSTRLVFREGALVNGPRLPETSAGNSKLPFDDLTLSDASLSIEAAPLGSAQMQHADIDVEVSHGEIIELRAVTTSASITHQTGTERISNLEVRARVTPGYILLHTFKLETPEIHLALSRTRLPMPLGSAVDGRVDARVDVGHLASLPHGLTLPSIQGTVEAHINAHYDAQGPTGEGRVSYDHLIVQEFGAGDHGDLDLSLTRDQLRIHQGAVRIVKEGGIVNFHGSLGLGTGMPIDATVDVQDLAFEKLMDQLGVTENCLVSWLLDAQIHLGGTANPLALDGTIHTQSDDFSVTSRGYADANPGRVIGVERARVDGHVSVREDGLRFERLTAEMNHSRLRADVLVGFHDQLYVRAESDHLDLSDLTPLVEFPIGGIGTATALVEGTFHEQRVTGTIGMNSFTFDGKPLGDLHSDWALEHGGLAVRFPMISATKNESRYRIEDFLLNFDNDRVELTGVMRADHLRLSDFYAMVNYDHDDRFEPYQGVIEGPTLFRFTKGFPEDSPTGTLVTDMDLDVPSATLNDYAFTNGHFAGEFRWLHYEQGVEGGELDIHHAELHKGRGTVAVSGHMALGGRLDITAVADNLALGDLEGIGDRMPDLAGSVGLTARISGNLDVPHANMDVMLSSLSWQSTHLGDARAYVRLTDQTDPWITSATQWSRTDPPASEPCAHARVGFARGRWPEDPPLQTRDGPKPALARPMAFLVCGEGLNGHVKVDMAIGQTDVHPLRGMLDVNGFDLSPFLPSSGGSGSLRGSVSARIDLTGGAMLDAESLAGEVHIADLHLGQGIVELRNDGEIALRIDRSAFEIAHAELIGPASRLSLAGGGSLERLATTVTGEIDLGLLGSLFPTVSEARGRIGLQMRLSGPMSNPEVYGTAEVEHAGFRFASFSEPIEELNGRLTFSQRSVDLDNFRANVAGGTLSARGSAAIEGRWLSSYNIELSARDLALAPQDGVELGFGGDARLQWERGDRIPNLHGTVRIRRFLYTRPIQLGQTLNELSRRRRQDVQRYDPAADRVSLDLRVVDDSTMHVANNLIEAELTIEDSERPFRVVGTDQRFGVLGTLAVNRGTVRWRNAVFEIQRGKIDFDNESEIDPRFDVRAMTIVRRNGDFATLQWRIMLHARGTADALELATSSEPDLSQEDIVLLLTMGMTRAEAQQVQAGQLTQTAALEALATVTGVDREVRNAIPLIDEFSFSSAYSVRTGRMEPQAAVGRRISDRVRVRAMRGIGETADLRANIEWRLNDSSSVQGSYDNVNTTGASSLGNLGVDVRWRLEFE
jgi:translocation and assembly module TamB